MHIHPRLVLHSLAIEIKFFFFYSFKKEKKKKKRHLLLSCACDILGAHSEDKRSISHYKEFASELNNGKQQQANWKDVHSDQ